MHTRFLPNMMLAFLLPVLSLHKMHCQIFWAAVVQISKNRKKKLQKLLENWQYDDYTNSLVHSTHQMHCVLVACFYALQAGKSHLFGR